MIINVSRVQSYLECPTKEHYRWRLQRAPAFDGVPRVTGTAWHAACEALLRSRIADPAAWDIDAGRAALAAAFAVVDRQLLSDEDLGKLRADAALLDFLLPHLTLPDGITLLAVEAELTAPAPHGDQTFRGRPDALAIWNGKLWHVQHKTCSASTSWPLFDASIARSFHEGTYQYLLNANRNLLPAAAQGLPIAGTILLAVKKLSMKSAQANPASCFHTAFLPIEPAVARARLLTSLERIAESIEAADLLHTMDIPVAPIENRSACFGAFGNMPCTYLAVCQERVAITDPAYFKTVDPLASYGSGTPTPVE